MKKIYILNYLDGCTSFREVFEHTEVAAESKIVPYVCDMIAEGRINDDSIEIFNEKHAYGVQTPADAVELLETDGYMVKDFEIEV